MHFKSFVQCILLNHLVVLEQISYIVDGMTWEYNQCTFER